MKKICILLGAYIDSVNAQDINCYEIAKRLDANKFEVHAFVYDSSFMLKNVKCHKISRNRLLKKIEKMNVMKSINADIYYLPRVEKVDYLFAKMYGKKKCIVSSVEIQTVYEKPKYKKFFTRYIADYFCISNFLNELNERYWGKKKTVLYLGVPVASAFEQKSKIERFAFVGSLEERKHPLDFLEMGENFPDYEFVMIGSGSMHQLVIDEIERRHLNNVSLMGRLDNVDVIETLKNCSVLLMTSEKEGLPKVVLEAAACGVPSIYINKNYSIDYIENGKNGFGIPSLDAMTDVITSLLSNPQVYRDISYNVSKLSDTYNWDNLITQYELYFLKVNNVYNN